MAVLDLQCSSVSSISTAASYPENLARHKKTFIKVALLHQQHFERERIFLGGEKYSMKNIIDAEIDNSI